jgi:hypothetical protein
MTIEQNLSLAEIKLKYSSLYKEFDDMMRDGNVFTEERWNGVSENVKKHGFYSFIEEHYANKEEEDEDVSEQIFNALNILKSQGQSFGTTMAELFQNPEDLCYATEQEILDLMISMMD